MDHGISSRLALSAHRQNPPTQNQNHPALGVLQLTLCMVCLRLAITIRPKGHEDPDPGRAGRRCHDVGRLDTPRRGTHGVSTNGVTANSMFFDRGTFWGTPVNLLLSSQKVPGCTFFPNLR